MAVQLAFHDLSYVDDGDEVVVGRRDIDSYGVFPPDGAALVRKLANGMEPAAAAAWYQDTYGTAVDMTDLIDTLRELRLLREHDEPDPRPVRWQRLGRWLFSPAAWVVYACLVVVAIAVCVARPGLIPHRGNIFFTDYLVVIEVTLLLGQVPLTLLHEWFHVMAGRRLGLRSKVGLGWRMYFVVFETSLDGLVSVPRRSRYLPMLAGMLMDLLVMSALTVLAYLTWDSLLAKVCLAFAFTTFLRITWQFYFFLRTDVYYLVTTVLGCVDLQTTTREMLRNRVNAVLGRPLTSEAHWHPRDRAVARWYLPLHVAGYAFMIALLVTVLLPMTWQFLGNAGHTLLSDDVPPARVADAAIVLTTAVAQFALAGYLALRARRNRATSAQEES
ncbi:hypothetical protein [Lentzea terrae]|uniref:hypothetical protein n=1 Tax=Lentzea terrae TaxID=2200761 RepID=UPI000DD357F7|nr:hypothetical protein [Lentzea terrae]